VKEFNNEEIVAIDIEAHAVFKVSCCCHKILYGSVLIEFNSGVAIHPAGRRLG
jgi:hypothetical protein